ncbi:MAG: MMPL family transporter [Bacteroidota bacterium]
MNHLFTNKSWILGLLVLASLLCAGGMQDLRVSHRMDDYFSAEGDDLQIYQQYRSHFGDDDQFFLVSITPGRNVYSPAFRRRIRHFKESVEQMTGIRQAIWLDDFLLGLRIWSKEIVAAIPHRKLFVSDDHQSIAILIEHETPKDKAEIRAMVSAVQQALTIFEGAEIHLAGKIYFTSLLEDFMRKDSANLFLATLILIVIFLGGMLGSIRLLLISLLVPVLAIAFSFGLMGRLGFQLNLFTTLVPTLVLIISVSDILHLVKGSGPKEPEQRIRYHLPPLLLTSLTTSIGFASLMTTEIEAIMVFGAFVAIGVIYTFFLTIFLFAHIEIPAQNEHNWLEKLIEKCITLVIRLYKNRKLQWFFLVMLLGLPLWGIQSIRSNAYLISGVPQDSDISRNIQHFDQNFAGTRPLSIFIQKKTPETDIPLSNFSKLDSLIRYHFQSEFLLGPHLMEESRLAVQADDGLSFRFFGLMPDRGSAISSVQHEAFQQSLSADPILGALDIHYTGLSRMADKNTRDTSNSILHALFTALVVTFVLLAVYFRGIKVALISIVVNVIPLLVLGAAYGLLGIELRAGNSVAFSIAFGIAVDDTMHMLASYRTHCAAGFDQVIRTAGRPVLMTTLVLGISFSVLTLSGLEAIRVLGFSMLIGSLAALLADLIILPALLAFFPPSTSQLSQDSYAKPED